MSKTFEDAFMDSQSSMISLCMELLEDTRTCVDKIFVYTNCSEHSFFFNVFFEKDNKIFRTCDLFEDESVDELIQYGTEDLIALFNTCKEYNRNYPHEMKMIFDTHSHKFDANYRYEEFSDDENGPTSLFMNWREEINKKLCV